MQLLSIAVIVKVQSEIATKLFEILLGTLDRCIKELS